MYSVFPFISWVPVERTRIRKRPALAEAEAPGACGEPRALQRLHESECDQDKNEWKFGGKGREASAERGDGLVGAMRGGIHGSQEYRRMGGTDGGAWTILLHEVAGVFQLMRFLISEWRFGRITCWSLMPLLGGGRCPKSQPAFL